MLVIKKQPIFWNKHKKSLLKSASFGIGILWCMLYVLMSFQNGVVFQTLLRPVRWWRNRFLTDLICRTTRSVEQHSDGVKSFCWVSIQCVHYLGATAQLPEWACQWTLVWARVEHFLMALHSGMAIGMQYHSDWLPSKANTYQGSRTGKY